MRKTTLAIYKWDDSNAWVYVGCTPDSEQAESEENVKGYRNFGEKVLHEGKILDCVANMSGSDYIQMYRVRYTNNVDFVVMLKNGIAVCW